MQPRKKTGRKGVHFTAKKYLRWLRLYVRRVRSTEKELGGTIDAC